MAKHVIAEDDKFKLGISTSVLFDVSEADAIWRAEQKRYVPIGSYRTYMMSKLDEPLPLRDDMIKMLRDKLHSGKYGFALMSKNSALCGVRAIKTLVNEDLVPRHVVFTNGASIAEYTDIYDVDMFMTTNMDDASKAQDLGVASCSYEQARQVSYNKAKQIITDLRQSTLREEFAKNAVFQRLIKSSDAKKIVYSFDFDKVIGGPESDDFYVSSGRNLSKYHANEQIKYEEALAKGPWFKVYQKIMREFQEDHLVHINTARSFYGALRMFNTLAQWGVEPNGEIHCTATMDKTPVLQEIRRRYDDVTFLDDGERNVKSARAGGIRTGHVPSASTSNLMPS